MGKIIGIMLMMILLGFGVLVIYNNYYASEILCLEKIAEDYCEEKGFEFGDILWGSSNLGWSFTCKEDVRNIHHIEFKFMEEEIEKCKK